MESDTYHPISSLFGSIYIENFSGGVIISLSIMILLLAISAFVSGSEVAYFSLTPGEINILKKSHSRLSKMALSHLQMPDRLLATILITNNFVNVSIVVLSSFIISTVFGYSGPSWIKFLIKVVLVTFMILFCSEIFPKIYANRISLKFVRIAAPGLKFFSTLFWPFSSFLIYSTSIVHKRLVKHTGNVSIDDLSDALELTEPSLTEEKDILKGIVKFGNIDVCDIMRSRVDTVAVDIKTRYKELLRIINESGYSRIPVFEGSFDQIKGILYVKDLMPYLNKSGNFKWQALIRPSFFVPESKKINDLLKEFQRNRIHMAIVVDEYGGTSGIVTLEDILEEIVGEISDESDNEPLPYEKIDDDNFIFEGRVLLNDFCRILGIDDSFFDTVKGDADTIAGLILELRREIPLKEEMISFKNLVFTIVSVDKRRIRKIKVTIRSDEK